jgi:hypothetical protein
MVQISSQIGRKIIGDPGKPRQLLAEGRHLDGGNMFCGLNPPLHSAAELWPKSPGFL